MSFVISKKSIDTLKRIYDVNQCLRFVGGENVLKCASVDKTTLVHAPIDRAFPRDFNVYDLREFLSVLNIIPDAELDFSNDNCVLIKSSDGKQKIRYYEADPEFITSYIDKVPNLSDSDIALTVSVTEDQFHSVVKSASTMKLEYIGFICDGQKVYLSAFNKHNGDLNNTNQFSVEVADYTLNPFEMFYKVINGTNINILLNEGDLKFDISPKKISRIGTESGKTFWIAMNINSEFK